VGLGGGGPSRFEPVSQGKGQGTFRFSGFCPARRPCYPNYFGDFASNSTLPVRGSSCRILGVSRWLGRRNRFRGAQRDRRLDQSADVTSVRSAVQPPTVEPAANRPGIGVSLRSRTAPFAVDHDAVHGVSDGRAYRYSIERRGPDRPSSVSVAATRRRKQIDAA
jgi:hypothetical protein